MSGDPALNATNLRVLAEAIEHYHAIKSYAENINFSSATVIVSWDTGGAIAGHRVATEKVGLLIKASLTHYVADAVIMAKNDVISAGRRAGILIDEAAL